MKKLHSKVIVWALAAAMFCTGNAGVYAAEPNLVADDCTNYSEISESEEFAVTEYATADVFDMEETSEPEYIFNVEETYGSEYISDVEETSDSENNLSEQSVAQVKACGSDGILYNDVSYLPAVTVAGFDADMQSAYIALCDEISEWQSYGDSVSDIVLFVDESGTLGLTCHISERLIYAAEDTGNIDENESGSENKGIVVLGEEISAQILENCGITDCEFSYADSGDNLDLAQSHEISEEDIDRPEINSINGVSSKYISENYFRDQLLSDDEKKMYDRAKTAMVKGSANSFTVNTLNEIPLIQIANVLSAIQDAYPDSFEWVDRGRGSVSITYNYSGGHYTNKIIMSKSEHYSPALLSEAQKKVRTVTEQAYKYAGDNYPDAPSYGMVKYFDDWICKNNFYNNIGLGNTEKDMLSKEFYYCHSSIGILLKGYGVCESYALAMYKLLSEAGIPSVVVYGTGNGGGHAWNYVQMPDGNWYMLDSTWNDGGNASNGRYFITESDSRHVATGARFTIGQNFTYPTLADIKYPDSAEENIQLNRNAVVLTKGKKAKLELSDSYYEEFKTTWSADNVRAVRVDNNGNVTAVAPGKSVISCKVAGKTVKCDVYVYQWTGMTFADNKKTSYSYIYTNEDMAFDETDSVEFHINVGQKNMTATAEYIAENDSAAVPKAVVSNPQTAMVSSCTLSDNEIILKLRPKAVGNTNVNVSFGGKKVVLKLKVAQGIQEKWFNELSVSQTEFTGKAFKPKVTTSSLMPKDVKYKVKYSDNKNAGTAKVSVTGIGKYSGTITRTFEITARDFTQAEFVSCSAYGVYNGKERPASTVVKWHGKKLKQGQDYIVLYDESDDVCIDSGSYEIKVKGVGNYSGMIEKQFNYTVKKAPITSVKISVPSVVKYKGGEDVTPNVAVRIGKVTLSDENYTLTFYDSNMEVVSELTQKGKYTLEISPKGNVTTTDKKSKIVKKITVK